MSETTIYGHAVPLEELEPGDTVTDVIVLARAIRMEDDGTISDALLATGTPQTTGLIQEGMAAHLVRRINTPEEEA
ncbi:hypothetical protein [Nesterenkonia suensis]